MRVTQSETYRNFLTDLDTLNTLLNRLSRQVSSGKKLSELGDSPSGSAELIHLTDLESDIDRYRSSADTVSYFLRVADSALNEVNNLVTSVYAKGSEAASTVMSDEARGTLAADIRSFRDQILSLANSEAKGRYVFAGSAVSSEPFVLAGDTVSYKGNTDIGSVEVDGGMEVNPGISGSEAFGSVFSAIESLLTAIDSNDVPAIGTALGQFASAISDLGQARGKIGAGMNVLENVQARLDVQETSLKEQRSHIQDADLSDSVVKMAQAKTALQTAMSAGGSILSQRNLFDFLG